MGIASSTVLTQCTGSAGSGVTLMLNNPVCESTSDPNYGASNYVEAVVSQQVPTTFGRLVGVDNLLVSAHAEAVRGIGPCIYALDPSGAAITIVAGVIVKSRCGIVDESSSSNALSCVVGIAVYAPSIDVTGGSQGLLCGIQTDLHTGVPVQPPPDPLAYVNAPSNASSSCGTTTSSPYTGSSKVVNVLLGGNVVFNPGVYCGGISITAALASTITFNPGTYILRDATGFLGTTSGGLNITLSVLSTITGSGVTFYNEGPVGGFSVTEPVTNNSLISLNNVNLTAPSTGTYGGILFFQAHGVSASGTFLANLVQGSNLQGAIYLPDGAVDYGVSAISSSYNILVAKDINFLVAVASTFGADYSSLGGVSPLDGNNVSLVQ